MYDSKGVFMTAQEPRQHGHPGRRLRFRRTGRLGLLAAVPVLSAAWSAPAMADPTAPVTCGTVVTSSITLHADLNCTGDGLIIGADGISVSLAGHSITGDGTGTGISSFQHGGLTVSNGTIAGFATGAGLIGLQQTVFDRVTIRDGVGVRATFTEDAKFTGVELYDSRVVVSGSRGTAFDHVIARNAPFLLSEANETSIVGGDLVDSRVDGFESDHVSIVDSELLRSPISYTSTSRDWLIQDNTIRDSAVGLQILNTSPRGRVIGNTFKGNGVGIWVRVGFLDELDGTVIADNTFVDNGAAGVLVDITDVIAQPTMTIGSNRFLHNGFEPSGRTDHLGGAVADGAHIASAAGSMITVADNLANGNAAYGIFAVPGTVVDGGGNKSNGDPLACLGVTCT